MEQTDKKEELKEAVKEAMKDISIPKKDSVRLPEFTGEQIKAELSKLSLPDIKKEVHKARKYLELAEGYYNIARHIE